jgi:hypothetical protein
MSFERKSIIKGMKKNNKNPEETGIKRKYKRKI